MMRALDRIRMHRISTSWSPALCGPAARHMAHSSHHQTLDNPNHDRRASRCRLRPLAFDRSETTTAGFHRSREGGAAGGPETPCRTHRAGGSIKDADCK